MKFKVIHPYTDEILGESNNALHALEIFANNDLYGIIVLEEFKEHGLCYLLEESSAEKVQL